MDTTNSTQLTAGPERREDGWEVSAPEDAGLDPEALAEIVAAIEADEHGDFHALLIARRGRLAFEAYFNGYEANHLHDIRSAGKSFTATLIGIAIDQGAIPGVDAYALPYFEKFQPIKNPDPRKDSIRIADLLTMSSGLDADDADAATPGCENTMLETDDWIRYGLDLPMAAAPGGRWVYAGVNTMLLAGLLEAATERPALDFAQDHLFEPLGIAEFAWAASPAGTVAGQGFLMLRGRDQLKLGQLYLDGGTWRGNRIVTEGWTRAATERRFEIPSPWPAGYGYQWWWIDPQSDKAGPACHFASGNGGNKIYVLPALDMVVAMAASAYNQPYMHTRCRDILLRVIGAAG